MTLLIKDSVIHFIQPRRPLMLMTELCCDEEIAEESLENAGS